MESPKESEKEIKGENQDNQEGESSGASRVLVFNRNKYGGNPSYIYALSPNGSIFTPAELKEMLNNR
ncbi:MAG: hypothetical protein A3I89_00105 [Candidatus Harrisonbacteria bacterium RIFCSPLOWO2_02_FULL_41_11]|uniref:Uncharacterized protein n=1 Tax=Candidatus Harrisonbacteria bacterium RIFCSPHIGHO2_02_FULL_42_16 TaxID=1798404 RepID=A0A1G1ZIR2_9BACT|nr:MAG: hypothetical protein A3B92_04160 [Candidatus Harrisonbacteria bacterium RIFCSPHIGHO2_02_FULL_42_16]OGY66907.1 MAG: hypothetical protein A3I89_00105 [Candidatus Harrisonbacteria bacterium RIFCSPLOWO2_02_FULL_41_11]